jgi:hypothetical protein
MAYWSNAVTNTTWDSNPASMTRRATSNPVSPGHLDVEHHEIRLVLLDYVQRLDSVSRLADDLDAAELLEQETQLGRASCSSSTTTCGAVLEVRAPASTRSPVPATASSGMTMRAQVPWPGTLSSCSW